MKIKDVNAFRQCIAQGPTTDLGGYPVFFICRDGGVLSFHTAAAELQLIEGAIRDGDNDQWQVVAADINWKDEALCCDHSGEYIKCAYPKDDGEEAAREKYALYEKTGDERLRD